MLIGMHYFRHAVWSNEVRKDPKHFKCGAANEKWRFRHTVCIFGLEDLHRLTKRHELFLNKMMPSFDYGAVNCWMEYMYNRTHYGETRAALDLDFYANLPNVRYHRMKKALPAGKVWNKYTFNCTAPEPHMRKVEASGHWR